MTDHDIQELFTELRRVGYDLARPPGLALGTGFAPGELVAWLRTQPDAVGHDAVAAGMDAHVVSASPLQRDAVPGERDRTQWLRDFPSHEQLDAAVQVLLAEWDPLGARLGILAREDVSEHAFGMLLAVVANPSSDGIEAYLATAIAGIEEETFGVRPSPVVQRRYLARRLVRVVADHPTPPGVDRRCDATDIATGVPMSPGSRGRDGSAPAPRSARGFARLGPRGDEPPALDPTATCSACGTTGTVAYVTRDVQPAISRYCTDCWRRVRHRYWGQRVPTSSPETPDEMIDFMQMFDDLTRERQRSAGSALWEDLVPSVRGAIESPADGDARDADHRRARLGSLARQLARVAPRMAGPMPPEIADFVRAHAGRGA